LLFLRGVNVNMANKTGIKTIRNLTDLQNAQKTKDASTQTTGRDGSLKHGIAGATFVRQRRNGLLTVWGHADNARNWNARIEAAQERGETLPQAKYQIYGLKKWLNDNPRAEYFAVWAAPCGRLGVWTHVGKDGKGHPVSEIKNRNKPGKGKPYKHNMIDLTKGASPGWEHPCHCAECNVKG
jgi:hypothetical protein